jgi:acid phosphatase
VDTTNPYLNEYLPSPLEALGYSDSGLIGLCEPRMIRVLLAMGVLQSVTNAYIGQKPTYNYIAPLLYDAAASLDLDITIFAMALLTCPEPKRLVLSDSPRRRSASS